MFLMRNKLALSPTEGIFVGYSETSKGYWIYISMQWKTMVHMDVKFNEDGRFSRSHEPPTIIEGREKLDVPD